MHGNKVFILCFSLLIGSPASAELSFSRNKSDKGASPTTKGKRSRKQVVVANYFESKNMPTFAQMIRQMAPEKFGAIKTDKRARFASVGKRLLPLWLALLLGGTRLAVAQDGTNSSELFTSPLAQVSPELIQQFNDGIEHFVHFAKTLDFDSSKELALFRHPWELFPTGESTHRLRDLPWQQQFPFSDELKKLDTRGEYLGFLNAAHEAGKGTPLSELKGNLDAHDIEQKLLMIKKELAAQFEVYKTAHKHTMEYLIEEVGPQAAQVLMRPLDYDKVAADLSFGNGIQEGVDTFSAMVDKLHITETERNEMAQAFDNGRPDIALTMIEDALHEVKGKEQALLESAWEGALNKASSCTGLFLELFRFSKGETGTFVYHEDVRSVVQFVNNLFGGEITFRYNKEHPPMGSSPVPKSSGEFGF